VADAPNETRPAGARWTLALVVASVFWAGGGLVARGAPMSGPQFAFWRSLGGAVFYQLVLAIRGTRPRWAQVRDSAVGGLGFGLSILFLFAAFKSTTLVSANVITALTPILLGVVSTRLHHDPLPRGGVLAMAVGIGGTVVTVAGSSGGGAWSLHGDLLAVVAVVLGCLYPIGTKSARKTLDALEFQAGALWVSAVVCGVGALVADREIVVPTARGWGFVALLIGVGGTGHLIFSWAQHHVSVAAASVILLLEIVWSALGAVVFFDQPLGPVQVLGMLVVSLGVVAWVRAEASSEAGSGADPDADPLPTPNLGG
jgi:drug/metabolite transporter (DMT)-like permease